MATAHGVEVRDARFRQAQGASRAVPHGLKIVARRAARSAIDSAFLSP